MISFGINQASEELAHDGGEHRWMGSGEGAGCVSATLQSGTAANIN